jgi:hypothetical protein
MNDYIYGAVSGIFQTIIGHPFDTKKVLMQNNKVLSFNYRNMMAGIKYPIMTSSLICSVNFGSYNTLYEAGYSIPVAGFLSGVVVTPIVYVTDIGKVKCQVGRRLNWRDIIKNRQRGLTSTFLRESLSFAMYFWSFDYAKNTCGIHPFFAGAIAGLSNWTLTYPIDVIRSRQLADNISLWEALKKGELWRGYGICAIRAVLVNSVGFYVYDFMKENE